MLRKPPRVTVSTVTVVAAAPMLQPSLLQVLLNPKKLRGLGRSLGTTIGNGIEQAFAVGKHITRVLQYAGAALGLSSPGSGLHFFY